RGDRVPPLVEFLQPLRFPLSAREGRHPWWILADREDIPPRRSRTLRTSKKQLEISFAEATMSRSNYLMIPISGQGIIVDPGTKDIMQKAMVPPFGYTDLLLYSHGWWTSAETAMIDYNRFLMGLAPIVVTADAA